MFSKTMRMACGKRVGWKCERCGKGWHDGWLLEFHHRIPQHSGGKDTRKNCECLCLNCHLQAHINLARQGLGHPNSPNLIRARINRTNGGRHDRCH